MTQPNRTPSLPLLQRKHGTHVGRNLPFAGTGHVPCHNVTREVFFNCKKSRQLHSRPCRGQHATSRRVLLGEVLLAVIHHHNSYIPPTPRVIMPKGPLKAGTILPPKKMISPNNNILHAWSAHKASTTLKLCACKQLAAHWPSLIL
jgi:hypothetical protein